MSGHRDVTFKPAREGLKDGKQNACREKFTVQFLSDSRANLSLPKDCAAGQEACGQLLTLTVSGEGFSFSWEVQNTTLDEKCLNSFFADCGY